MNQKAFPLLLACSAYLLTLPVMGQVTTGSILGSVTDSQGDAVGDATVTVVETSKSTVFVRQTDALGSYSIPFLIPGAYQVTVEKSGFKKAKQKNLPLAVNQQLRADFVLSVGDVSEIVEVVSSAPLVSSTSAELGQVVGLKAVQELPLNGRNFAQLVYLANGVTPGQAGENLSGASTFNPRGASNFNGLGSRANTNSWLIDGIDNNEYTFNTVIVQPSLESVREFKVLTGSFSAEFGRGASVVSVSTRSGSNQLHGAAFWFHRNSELDARQYNFSQTEQPKLPFRRHQFGAAFSGPVHIPKLYNGKNRTFFFADYAGQREFRGNQFINSVPTASMRQGNFTETGRTIFDPLTTRSNPNGSGFIRDPYPGNVIPAAQINPVGRNVASIYPLPNTPGSSNGTVDNFVSVADRNLEDNQYTIRIDHQFSNKDNFFARFAQQRFNLDSPQGQANCCLPTPAKAAARFDLGPFVAGIQQTRLKTSGLALNWTRAWTPHWVTETRGGFSRTDPFTQHSDFGTRGAESLGIQGINVNEFASGIPTINVGLLTGLSGGPNFLPVRPQQWNQQLDFNSYVTRGRHSLKFGYHLVRRTPSPFTNQQTRGDISFNTILTADPQTRAGGHGLATLLTGIVQAGTRGFLLDVPELRAWENALFFQDDIKVTSRLTLNLGVRYELFTPEIESNDLLTNFDRSTLSLAFAGQVGRDRRLKSIDKNNFAPRVGLAYDLFGDQKTILRAGFGISYFPEPFAAGNMLTQNAPNLFSQGFGLDDFTAGVAAFPRIDNPFPAITPLRPTTTAQLNAAAPQVRGHDFNNKTGYSQTWTFNIQRQIGTDWVAEVGYAGSSNVNLILATNINEAALGTGSVQSRRFIQPLNNIPNITIFDPANRSSYHALLAQLERRYSNGLQFTANYTYAKSLDFGGSPASGGGQTGGPFTITCISCSCGPSGFDVRHRAVFNTLYDLPFGRGRQFAANLPRALDAVIGGWQFGGIVTATTGRPFNVSLLNGTNNGAPSWPLRIADGREPAGGQRPDLWFDPAAFAPTPANTFGNAGRGILTSPGVVNVDFHAKKEFNLTESVKFQVRYEAFNFFNTPFFGFPNASIGSPTAGRITSLVNDGSMRSMQISGRISF